MDRNKFKKRYTLKIGEKYYCSMPGDECKKQKSNPKDQLCCCSCEIKRQAYEKLAYYEDMEDQGKLMIIPCKPGDTVYELCKCDDGIYRIYPMIVKSLVPYGQIKNDKNGNICVWNVYAESDYTYMYKSFYDFGKTVFLTEQEAKEALERIKNESSFD